MKKLKYIKNLLFIFAVFFAGNIMVFAADGDIEYITCGSKAIPAPIPPITRIVVLVLQIILPIVIIIFGSMDFLKAVMAGDESKIKANQHQFINRLKIGLLFFLVIAFMKFAVSLFATQSDGGISNCISCLIDNADSCGSTTSNPFEAE